MAFFFHLSLLGSLSSSLTLKVAGFPYTKVAAVPAVSYAAAYPYAHAGVYYGKREAEVIVHLAMIKKIL